MVHIIAACADQAELINALLQEGSYRLIDLLPNGEKDFALSKYVTAFAVGSRDVLAPLIARSSPVYNALEKGIWKGSPTVFGHVVRFTMFAALPSHQFCPCSFLILPWSIARAQTLASFLYPLKMFIASYVASQLTFSSAC
jgi:hypothetical protein